MLLCYEEIMLRIFGFLLGVLVCDLIAMALIIVTECIKDVFRKPKHGSRSASRGSTSREDCEMPHAGRCNRYNVPHSSAGMYATASRMAQEAHDTAVRDSTVVTRRCLLYGPREPRHSHV